MNNQKRRGYILPFLIMSIIFLSIFVYAAGSSTTTSRPRIIQPTSTKIVAETTQVTNTTERSIVIERISIAFESRDCDSLTNRVERIECRLKDKKRESYSEEIDYQIRTPEACISLKSTTSCVALYRTVWENKCYDIEGIDKDKCFKRTIGIDKAKISEVPKEERSEKARSYVILLLYDIQERIEEKNENGIISDENAAEIIELIVQIKQQILDKEPRTEVVSNLNALKLKIREIN